MSSRAYWLSRASILLLFPDDLDPMLSSAVSVTLPSPPSISEYSSSPSLGAAAAADGQQLWLQDVLATIARAVWINESPAPPNLLSSLSAAANRELLSQVLVTRCMSASKAVYLRYHGAVRSTALWEILYHLPQWQLHTCRSCTCACQWFAQVMQSLHCAIGYITK
jgi:hypothetical protein